MGVDKEGSAKDGVHGRVQRTGSEGSDSEGDQRRSNQAVEGPVVGAMGRRRGRNRSRVVHYKMSLDGIEIGGECALRRLYPACASFVRSFNSYLCPQRAL